MLVAQDRHVLNALPMSAQPGAKAALAEINNAEDREHAVKAAEEFQADYGVKWPKAAARIIDGPRRAAGVLRLPGRALDPPAHHQPDLGPRSSPCGCASGSPKGPAHGPPGSRWRSS